MHEAPIHRVEERLPWPKNLLYSLQFLFVLTEMWLYPTLIAGAAGLSQAQSAGLLAISLLCGAAVTAAFAWKRLGVGLFLPSAGAAGLFAPLLFAAHTGGLALMATMSLLAGALQVVLTPLIRTFRVVMRPVLVGLVMTMLAVWMASLGIHQLFGAPIGEVSLHTPSTVAVPLFDLLGTGVGVLVLLLMSTVRLSRFRNWAILSGALVGWVALALLGRLDPTRLDGLSSASWIGWPQVSFKGLAFESNLIIPLILAVLYLCVTIFAKVASLQWASGELKYDMRAVRRANLISGLGVMAAGLVGAVPQTPKVEGLAMEQASGIFGRVTGYFYSVALVILALCPKFIALLATMPGTINGAVMLILSASAFSMGFSVLNFQKIPFFAAKSFAIAAIFGVTAMISRPLYEPFIRAKMPLALPGLMAAVVLFFAAEIFFFGLERMTHEA